MFSLSTDVRDTKNKIGMFSSASLVSVMKSFIYCSMSQFSKQLFVWLQEPKGYLLRTLGAEHEEIV